MKRFILPIAALLLSCGLFAQNPVIKGLYSADPTARVFNGKVYLFPSHDIISPVDPSADGSAWRTITSSLPRTL